MRKLCTNEVRGGQNEEKWKKNSYCNLKKKYFSKCSLLAAPLALLFKDVKPEKAFL
jgi:hypothetical protein